MSDHDLLIQIAEAVENMGARVEDIHDGLYGDGQPGLFDRVTRVETQVEERTDTSARRWGVGGGVAGVLAALLVALREVKL